jgi:hypothetical protein
VGTSQDLVPTNLPYGSRQKTVAAMQSADVPLSSEGGGGQPTPLGAPTAGSSPSPVAPATPVSRAGLSNFDALANRQPTPNFQPVPQRQVMFEQVRQSNNKVLQSIFERMAGYKEG